jgi:hypothetical protein
VELAVRGYKSSKSLHKISIRSILTLRYEKPPTHHSLIVGGFFIQLLLRYAVLKISVNYVSVHELRELYMAQYGFVHWLRRVPLGFNSP